MEILKIINKLQSYSEDVIAYKLDSEFACAVTEAVDLLVSQGERLSELEGKRQQEPEFDYGAED